MPDAVSQRNPPWQRDELILALDLYVRLGRRVPNDALLCSTCHRMVHRRRPQLAMTDLHTLRGS